MLHRRQVTASLINPSVRSLMLLLLFFHFFSCVAPKKDQYPFRKPYVYKTEIRIDAKMRNDQKSDLLSRLEGQLDDSLRARTVLAVRWKPPFLYRKLYYPPVFDTSNVSRSAGYMSAMMNSLGYYAPTVHDTITVDSLKYKNEDSVKDQYRVTVKFKVDPGKRLKFDSVGFSLNDSALQILAIHSSSQSLLKKGDPYSRQLLNAEIGRLVDTFRNNGYFKFSREDLYIEQDTVISALIDPSLDPFQQAELLQKLEKKRENPTINVIIRQRPVKDSTHLKKYYVGKVTAFPDLPTTEDTSLNIVQDTTRIRNIDLITRSNLFKLPFVANNIYLRPGRLYKQENYYRTFNRFNQLSAWQYINIDFDDSNIGDSLIDVSLRMYPAKKQNINIALEAARNTNDIVTATNLFGIGVSLALQNRNAFKQSVKTVTNARVGVEFGSDFIQSFQANASHSILFPRLILPFTVNRESRLKNIQSIANVNASYVDRYNYNTVFYKLRTVNGSWGYTWTKNNKTFVYKPINIEYNFVIKSDSLNEILKSNPSLNLAFRTGMVIGQQFAYTSIMKRANKTNRFRFTVEESGAVLGFITALDKGDLLRFIRGDVEYVHSIDFGKTQLALRGYTGLGLAYGRQGEGYEQTLPFYKAYFAGGPNSMRAWQIRQLGLGSSKFYNDTPYIGLDRFGDVQVEGNAEFRFPLGNVFGIKLKSAVFTDIGNIWNWKPLDTSKAAVGSDFQLNRFYKEFAIGAGTGLRLDFDYFIIRLDWAYKIRDPQRTEDPDKWFYKLSLGSGQFQLGINYPF